MKLKKVVIHKYKSIETDQDFDVNEDVTILVGMNESGKTSALEAISKTNYFQEDKKFKFNLTHDYPRREKKKVDKSGVTPNAITCTYSIDNYLLEKIKSDLGENVFNLTEFSVTTKYNNANTWTTLNCDKEKFVKNKCSELGLSNTVRDKLLKINSENELNTIISSYKEETITDALEKLKPFYKNIYGWSNAIDEYVMSSFLKPNLPKFLYYDEYYSLPSRISIEKLEEDDLPDEELKTARALFELADINTNEILESDEYEDFIAELEATQAIISDELFKYWSTNSNLNIEFRIQSIEKEVKRNVSIHGYTQEVDDIKITEHVLDIRVKNTRKAISLPLKNRSKGFNWFFSFLVWFKKIQEDNDSKYILLLDEPGLNLHASAQKDLLRFIEDLSDNYQVIYTTHSPFMIPNQLDRVRTVVETDKGSKISDSVQEKDPNTLFPLQAALGYDIAQNLFISQNNLLVEGISDLAYLKSISSILESEGRNYLNEDITIVPTGGLDKVVTFISLMRGSELNIVCLLDSFTNQKGKQKLDNIVREKLIHKNNVVFYDEFLDSHTHADIEDLFTKNDYLKLFNSALSKRFKELKTQDLNTSENRIIAQINEAISVSRFNHYLPSMEFSKSGFVAKDLDKETLDNFEKVIIRINKLFS